MSDKDDIWRLLRPTLGLGAAADLFPTTAATAPSRPNALASVLSAPANPYAGSAAASDLFGLVRQTTKRKVYFAFRFKDIMRVNNVRQSGKVGFDEETNPRAFQDRSIWEQRSITDPESLKRLMREAVEHSSVVCVLTGSDTWQGRWVKYEIARAVMDKKGLLNININGLNHHERRAPDVNGINPLMVMGIFQGADGKFYLAESRWEQLTVLGAQGQWRWHLYQDYTAAVPLPAYLKAPGTGLMAPLSNGARSYDYVTENGQVNLGAWVGHAAWQVGR